MIRSGLGHVIVFGKNHLRRIFGEYVEYHNCSRTHLSLDMNSPESRPAQIPDKGYVVAVPQVGGLHADTNAKLHRTYLDSSNPYRGAPQSGAGYPGS